ncbi:MmcQ/YjbR family DNA-binding protein [Corynebacterium durum]
MCNGCQHSTHEKPKALLIDNALRTTTLDAALTLPAAELYTFATDWEGVRVKGKWFLNTAVRKTTVREYHIVNVKAEPLDVMVLCQEYESITPGYRMNKRHWISIQPGTDATEALIQELVTDSYLLVVSSLPHTERPVDPATFETKS